MKHYFNTIFVIILTIILAAGCVNSSDVQIRTDLESEEINLPSPLAGSRVFTLITNMEWMISTPQTSGWIEFSPRSGVGNADITVTYDSNTADEARSIEIIITGIDENTNNHTLHYKFCQPASDELPEKYLAAEKTSVTGIPFGGAAGLTVNILANVPWIVESSDEWIVLHTSSGTGNGQVGFSVDANTGDTRTGMIILKCSDASLNVPDFNIKVVQDGFGVESYMSVDKYSFTNIPFGGSANLSFEVSSNVAWTAATTDAWISATDKTGTGNGTVRFSVDANSGSQRTGNITIKCNDSSLGVADITVQVVQNKYETGNSSMPYKWLELPAITEGGDLHFHTLYAPVNGQTKRNYSMLYDYKEKIAYWVAYPMHPIYLQGSGRSSWGYNPDVPSQYQVSDYASGYSKGHQIPSGDRHTSNNLLNKQTFYYTNMTPQLQNGFNGTIWNNMEQAVRNWTNASSDTLYVVTGAVLRKVGGNETVNRESKNNIAIPNYYYKVMIKKKSNSTAGYTAIGFWFEHKNYSETKPSSKYAVTVDQVEEWTGFDFFANLPEEEQNKVESEMDLSQWPL